MKRLDPLPGPSRQATRFQKIFARRSAPARGPTQQDAGSKRIERAGYVPQ